MERGVDGSEPDPAIEGEEGEWMGPMRCLGSAGPEGRIRKMVYSVRLVQHGFTFREFYGMRCKVLHQVLGFGRRREDDDDWKWMDEWTDRSIYPPRFVIQRAAAVK